MNSDYYPKNLLEEYELLLQYFPSHKICRPFIVDSIKQWQETYSQKETVRILEIGPGFGETTSLILEQIPCVMTLVEADENTCNVLAGMLSQYEGRIEIVHADAIEWIKHIPSQSYDAFTASWAIHNFPVPVRDQFLIEVERILKPEGLFVIFEKVLPDDQYLADALWQKNLSRLDRLDDVGKTDLKVKVLEHEERDAHVPYVWYERELLHTLETLTFTNITVHNRNEREIVVSAMRIK